MSNSHRPKIVQQALLGRVSQAATAAERLATGGFDGEVVGDTDRIAMAYLYRLLEAAARIEEYTEYDRRTIEPDPRYLGRLADAGFAFTANRNPDPH